MTVVLNPQAVVHVPQPDGQYSFRNVGPHPVSLTDVFNDSFAIDWADALEIKEGTDGMVIESPDTLLLGTVINVLCMVNNVDML